MESFRKLSNFSFSVDKNLETKIISIIAFFLTLFKGYKCNRLYEITPKKQFLWEPAKTNFKSFEFHKTGLKIKKSSGHLLVTNWRNLVARCKFLVVSLHNVYDAAHSMVQSIRFDCLKISRTEVIINLEVNWLCVCNLAHFLWQKQIKLSIKCLFNFNLLL